MTDDRLHVSVREAARLLGVSRAQVYRLLDAGELSARKLGRRVDGWPDSREDATARLSVALAAECLGSLVAGNTDRSLDCLVSLRGLAMAPNGRRS